jgi:hypothetical protein
VRLRELESRIAHNARAQGVTVARYRDALNRKILLTTLELACRAHLLDTYAVKGGVAIELRFGVKVRATRDIDIDLPAPLDRLRDILVSALGVGCGDFTFSVKQDIRQIRSDAVRVVVSIKFAGLPWATMEVDLAPIALGDVQEEVPLPAEEIVELSLTTRSISVEQLIAQKIHAATCPDAPGYEFDYARHVIDVLFLMQAGAVSIRDVRIACEAVFRERGHRDGRMWPPTVALPERWLRDYEALLREYALALKPDEVPAAFSQLVVHLTEI